MLRSARNDTSGYFVNSLLAKCHKAIYQVAYFIYGSVLWKGSYISPIPVPQYNHLKNLDKAWIRKDQLENLRVAWDKHTEKVGQWAGEGL